MSKSEKDLTQDDVEIKTLDLDSDDTNAEEAAEVNDAASSIEEKSIEKKSIEGKSIEEKSIEEKSIEEKSIEEKSIEEKSIEEKSAEGASNKVSFNKENSNEEASNTEENADTENADTKTSENKKSEDITVENDSPEKQVSDDKPEIHNDEKSSSANAENNDDIELIFADAVPDDLDNKVLEPDNRKYHITGGDIVRYIILGIAIIVFAISATILIRKKISYTKEAAHNESIAEEVKKTTEEIATSDSTSAEPDDDMDFKPGVDIDFDRLLEINKDSVGWIEIPSIRQDYAIVQGEDNNYYLQHDMSGGFAWSGAIYLDYRNNRDMNDDNMIIYGHHMLDGTMFGNLVKYDSYSFYKEHEETDHNYVYIHLKDKIMVYKIYAVVDTYFETDKLSFTLKLSGNKRIEYLNHTKELQLYDTGVPVSPEDKLLTLYTCQSDSSSKERHMVRCKYVGEIKK